MNINARLRIATRIHFALLRYLGEGIDVGTMLMNEAEAREVLWVCDATGDPELTSLAQQYRQAFALEGRVPQTAAGHVEQETPWANSSGFGISQHAPEAPAAPVKAPATGRWRASMNWMRRSNAPTPR